MRVVQNQAVCCDDCESFDSSCGDEDSVCRIAMDGLGERVGLLRDLKGNG